MTYQHIGGKNDYEQHKKSHIVRENFYIRPDCGANIIWIYLQLPVTTLFFDEHNLVIA
jgi:hypothetical protein